MRTFTFTFFLLLAAVSSWGQTQAPDCLPHEIAKLLAADGAAGDAFGISVSLDGDRALVGAYRGGNDGSGSGSAYLFERTGGSWTQTAKLTPDDGAMDDWFGYSVSLSGDRALVGAPLDDDNGSGSGSAYLFAFDGSNWTQAAKLTADDGAYLDEFGRSVSLDGDRALIGVYLDDDNGSLSGSAYLFERTEGSWTQTAKLLATDGAAGDAFGIAVSLDGDRALIGARLDEGNGFNSGSAYLFEHTGGSWTQTAKLTPDDGATKDWFGRSVSLDGDRALVGALLDDDNGSNSGSAYLFAFDGSNWTQVAKLTADDGASLDRFGYSVSLDGDRALIGARLDDDNGSASGSAYLFEHTGGSWTQTAKLTPDDGAMDDLFGRSVSLDGDRALIGASGDFFGSGAYVFSVVGDEEAPAITCPADLVVAFANSSSVRWTAPTATDNCTASPSVVQTAGPANGAAFPVGSTIITYEATDEAGNTSTCSFTVEVLPAPDDGRQPVWTWVDGSDQVRQGPVYGPQGIPDPSSYPGSLNEAIGATVHGEGFLMGGQGFDVNSELGALHELWKWDGSQWTWAKGTQRMIPEGQIGFGSIASYGTQGVPDPDNYPGGRLGGVAWGLDRDLLYLFGGRGFAEEGFDGLLNDLWRWDGSNWTWISGSNFPDERPVYGEQGVAHPSNVPGARRDAMSWTHDRKLFLFGGQGLSADSPFRAGLLNDLWMWDGESWTWVHGSTQGNQAGNYGTKGIPDAENVPGGRRGATTWYDQGMLYLFGGRGYDANGSFGSLNDLWMWNGEVWTWIGGPQLADQAGSYGTLGISDPTNLPPPRGGANGWVLDGKLYLFGGEITFPDSILNDLWRWDGNNWTWIGGSNQPQQAGTYGQLGVPDADNWPGARRTAVAWKQDGKLMLYGGLGLDANGLRGGLGDLWQLDIPCPPPLPCDAMAGTLTARSFSCLPGTSVFLRAREEEVPVVPEGFEVLYVLTQTEDLVIVHVSDRPTFEVDEAALYTIHTLVYDPETLDLGLVEPGVTTGFDVNALLIQGGGTICGALDVAGAPFLVEECTPEECPADAGALAPLEPESYFSNVQTICFDDRTAVQLQARATEFPTKPLGFELLYVLTEGADLVIRQVNRLPVFTVDARGTYRIHTLVYNPETLDLSIVEPGVTTGFDVNALLIQGGGDICGALDVAGAEFDVTICGDCRADAGSLAPRYEPCFRDGSARLEAAVTHRPYVPYGFEKVFVLTAGEGLVIQAVNDKPIFNVRSGGIYTIHTLVYNPATLDLGIVEPGVTTGFDVNALLIQGGGGICGALDVRGARFDVGRGCGGYHLAVYPNPFRDRVTLEAPDQLTSPFTTIDVDSDVVVEVIGISGAVLYRRTIAGFAQREELDLSSLPAGLYTIRLIDEQGGAVETMRLTKGE